MVEGRIMATEEMVTAKVAAKSERNDVGCNLAAKRVKTTSSALPIGTPAENADQFGGRILKEDTDVYEHNAWDHFEWGEDQQREAEQIVYLQMHPNEEEANKGAIAPIEGKPLHPKAHTMPKRRPTADEVDMCNTNAAELWDKFYRDHRDKFFKKRNWLSKEFPEIFSKFSMQPTDTVGESSSNDKEIPPVRLLEIGCGTGSTAYPLLLETEEMHQQLTNPTVGRPFVYACDFSSSAVNLVKKNEHYDETKISAFVYDLTKPDFPKELENMVYDAKTNPDGGLDFILAIFVLSAIKPNSVSDVIRRLYKLLKPGGILFFRDYGRYDLAQLRMRPCNVLGENFYRRGDDTQVYFFDSKELATLFEEQGFETYENSVDRRLIVNRKRKLRMFRVWLQAKFRRPL